MVPAFDLPGAVRFNDALAQGRGKPFKPAEVGPDDIAVLQYTGGTTGVSKGAVLLHRNLVANILQSEAWYQPALKKIPPGEQVVTICALPIYHIFGFNTNMMLAMRMGGCNILIANPRDLPACSRSCRARSSTASRPSTRSSTRWPTTPTSARVDWSGLVISVGGGMAVQSATAKLWLEKTGCPIVEGYGLSETSPSATCNPVDSTAYSGNIGLPMPNTELKLLDDDGNEVPLGTPGEIAIKGPQVMAGYWQRPDETAKVMTADGFFRSGDIGVVDERGYFKIVDRKKDMILVSGFNVYPNEVEDVVTQMPGILECAAVGIPDAKAGEAVKLVIVSKDPAVTEADGARLLRGQPDRLQAAEDRRVPQRAAEDAGRQDPAPRAARQSLSCRRAAASSRDPDTFRADVEAARVRRAAREREHTGDLGQDRRGTRRDADAGAGQGARTTQPAAPDRRHQVRGDAAGQPGRHHRRRFPGAAQARPDRAGGRRGDRRQPGARHQLGLDAADRCRAPPAARAAPLDYAQFTAALTKIISSQLGLRGFTLTLAVEKAGTIEELRDVAQRAIEQIRERKGEAAAAEARKTLYGG